MESHAKHLRVENFENLWIPPKCHFWSRFRGSWKHL